MLKKLVAIGTAIACMVVCTVTSFAQTKSDAMQVVSLTTAIVAKELKQGAPEAHITKVSLNDSYAIVEWQDGRNGGQELLQRKFGIGWVPVAAGSEFRASSLAAYDIPPTMATALVAGIKSCTKPQMLTFHGHMTAVCFVGPCKVC